MDTLIEDSPDGKFCFDSILHNKISIEYAGTEQNAHQILEDLAIKGNTYSTDCQNNIDSHHCYKIKDSEKSRHCNNGSNLESCHHLDGCNDCVSSSFWHNESNKFFSKGSKYLYFIMKPLNFLPHKPTKSIDESIA
jgi:hypothetical protein